MLVLAHFENGYCGCDQEEVFHFEAGTELRFIEGTISEWAMDNADSFAYVHFGWEAEYTDEEYDEYIEMIEWTYENLTYEEYLKYCEDEGEEVRFTEEDAE